MKFILLVSAIALVSGVKINKNGIDDESYETYNDALKDKLQAKHENANSYRESEVTRASGDNDWRAKKPKFDSTAYNQ